MGDGVYSVAAAAGEGCEVIYRCSMIREFTKKAIGPQNVGRLRYWRNPAVWGGPFNGQRERWVEIEDGL